MFATLFTLILCPIVPCLRLTPAPHTLPPPPLLLQVILGAPYDTSADVWSLACMVFELVTGDFLFEPRAGRQYTRDEDHLAQMIELLGRMPRAVNSSGRHARDYFARDGRLRHIDRLNHWPMERVLVEKYRMDRTEASLQRECILM